MATVEAAQIYRGLLGANQLLVSADLSWSGVHNIPRGSEPRLTFDDEDSWGYRVQLAASYSSVFGGINLSPFMAFSHDIDGTTPGPISSFIEDRKSLTLGIRGTYINRIVTELRYTGFIGGGRDNLLRDRDYLRFQVSYYL